MRFLKKRIRPWIRAKMHLTIITHHRLHINSENDTPAFPWSIWINFQQDDATFYDRHDTQTMKYDTSGEACVYFGDMSLRLPLKYTVAFTS